jgi:methyl-accepting chemotaxis protein
MPLTPRFLDHYRKADRIMLGLIWLLSLFAWSLAYWHNTFIQAFLVGDGTRLMRCCLGIGLMVMAALHINQAEGVIESHFGIFALLAVLTFYRDWLPILVAVATIAVHHVVFHALQHQGFSVYIPARRRCWQGRQGHGACIARGSFRSIPDADYRPG